jgi:cupin fold WbuC family metalloprotein
MQIVTHELLHQVIAGAQASPRLRMNHNLHPSDHSRCHRLLNAIEPASYIRPHRHLDQEKDEAFILLSGKLGVMTFDENGAVTDRVLLSHASGVVAVDIPHGIFHTAISLASGTVFYEAKAGPYLPLTADETPAWAPLDSEPLSQEYLQQLRGLFE